MMQRYILDDFLKYKSILLRGTEEEQWDVINKIRKASSIEDSPPLNLIKLLLFVAVRIRPRDLYAHASIHVWMMAP